MRNIKANVDSNYESVTDQSGIKAGEGGFDIGVGKNTDLKGGIISSTADADKNKLSTGTLTYKDIENKADYKADNNGIGESWAGGDEYKYSVSKGMSASGSAESTTKSTISEGTIEIRDKENQKQDLAGLNRDAKNSLNKLGEIFDRTAVKDRMALADEFGKLAYKAVGDLAQSKGWGEGSKEKNALHAVVGGIMSKLGGSDFLAGASAGLINEMVQAELEKMFSGDDGMHELASALLGGVVSGIISGDAGTGESVANSATKNNYNQHIRPIKGILTIIRDDKILEEVNEGEYFVILLSSNLVSATNGALGVIVDKNGDVYDIGSIGLGISLENITGVSATFIKGKINNFDPELGYNHYLEGPSVGMNLDLAGAHFSLSLSKDDDKEEGLKFNTSIESGYDSASSVNMAGIGLSAASSTKIGSVYNEEIFNRDFERNEGVKQFLSKNNYTNVDFYVDEENRIRIVKDNQEYAGDTGQWVTIPRLSGIVKNWQHIDVDAAKKKVGMG